MLARLALLLPCLACLPSLGCDACSASGERPAASGVDHCAQLKRDETARPSLSATLAPFADRLATQTGAVVLDTGAQAMLMRAWLSEAAERSIDAQYFIFTADNVGRIATDYLLRAAERGVKVRVIVDDILLDADALELLALDAHPNFAIKVYTPNVNVGKTLAGKLTAAARDFRGVNQRMHNKTFVVDGQAVITGGRNIADEYFDYDHEYNFRDRDVLLLGAAARDVERSFERFWNDPLSVGIGALLDDEDALDPAAAARALHDYACDPANFWPEVREKIRRLPQRFDAVAGSDELQWLPDVRFVSDQPGKNAGDQGLGGGGATTDALVALIEGAKKHVFIQTPYLVTTAGTRALFTRAVARGVRVDILSNSLASTDNLQAFSGYLRDREALLATGVHVYEWRPDSAVRNGSMRSALTESIEHVPVFALHAKTMVVDDTQLVIGTFNLDPRSANLNTECITVLPSAALAAQVLARLRVETRPENAWRVTAEQDPDHHAGFWKRVNVAIWRVVPKSIL